MDEKLVSAVEWSRNKRKWVCSLIVYERNFSRIPLVSESILSFKVLSGRYCIGYTSVSLNKVLKAKSEKWRNRNPCPSKIKIENASKCFSCNQKDMIHPCLICDGRRCLATSMSIKESCKKSEAYVYIASFGMKKAKVGVAHKSRIPIRWIEQGANSAKRIIKGNGFEVRRIERQIHEGIDVFSGLRTKTKLEISWKSIKHSFETALISETERKIRNKFPSAVYCKDTHHNLLSIYSIPVFDRKPIIIRVKNKTSVSGSIQGVKGNILFIKMNNLPYILNLKSLVGRKIRLTNIDNPVLQTALDRF